MIFSENDTGYSLEATILRSPEDLQTGLWLVMAGVDDIPPHIALMNNGLYYSVSAKKVEAGVPIANFLKAISRRNTPTLFIQFKKPVIKVEVEEPFESYPPLGNGDHSCLWPVRDYFSQAFNKKYSKATLVFELLKMAEEDNLLLGCKCLFIEPPQLEQDRVTLPKYTHVQIREKISSLIQNS